MMNLKDYSSYLRLSANTIIKILLLLLILTTAVYAQTEQDSTGNVQTNEDSVFVMEKSPWGAVLRSAVLPGFGQFYNESYWKIPVVWGFIGYFAYVWIDNNDTYNKYSDLYVQSDFTNDNYKNLRDFYRDQRDEFAIYIGLTYFLQLVDAYVDAHLFDFNVTPDPVTRTPQLEVRFFLR
jgi:hypothetical protein